MEVNEGNIRITSTPFITIADKPLAECGWGEISKEIAGLCKVIAEQRETIQLLRSELVKVTEGDSRAAK